MRRSLLLTGILAGSLSGLAFAKDLAKVDGKPFTEAQFKDALNSLGPQAEMVKSNPQIRTQFLDHLINSQLLADEAKKNKIDQTKEYKEAMDAASREILAKVYLEKAVDKEAGNEAKLKEYFEKNKGQFSSKEVRASHILFKENELDKAKKALEEAKKKGADFDAIIKKYAADAPAGSKGDLNFFGRGRMVPEFEKAAFSTPKGQVHPELVKTQFGYHVIKVTNVKGTDDVKFKDKKEDVAKLYKQEVRGKLVKNLRDKAKVTVDQKALEQMKF